jgi:putative transposase
MQSMTKRAQKYRFYPTDEQARLFAQAFSCVRVVYNNILRWRTDVSSVALQQTIRDQQAAFNHFFAGRAKYPTYKKKSARQSARFTLQALKIKDSKIHIAKSKTPLDVKWSRELVRAPSSITISKDGAGRYFVSCLCEFEPVKLEISPKTVGVDLAITDDGSRYDNPRYTKKYASKLAKIQHALSKKKLGGANRAKAKLKVGRAQGDCSPPDACALGEASNFLGPR